MSYQKFQLRNGLTHVKREILEVKYAQWLRAVILFFFIVVPLYPYLSFLNSVGQPGQVIVFSGPVLKKTAEYKNVTSDLVPSRSIPDAILQFIAQFGEELFSTDHFFVTIMDKSLNKAVTLNVEQYQYKDLNLTSTFTKSMQRGRFGIPYNWKL